MGNRLLILFYTFHYESASSINPSLTYLGLTAVDIGEGLK
jgi:hypothetical protein